MNIAIFCRKITILFSALSSTFAVIINLKIMKKTILFASMLLGLTFGVQAQNISKNALGLRIGDNDGFGGEISYQRKLAKNNRLEFDLGLRGNTDENALKLAALYQWVWNIEKGFYWYAGAGAGVGSWSYKRDDALNQNFVFVAGDLGIEYNFDIPLQVSLDFRPELYINSNSYRSNNFGPDLALAIRYRFK